jgi:CubicO group peptidase (beta-lactamase class C family)
MRPVTVAAIADRMVAFLVLVVVGSLATAQSTSASDPTLNARQVADFFDRRVPELLRAHRVPGAVVAVVSANEVLLSRGYGRATVEPDRPATADTPFATGSVAKLFTWTAVMQLVEQNRVDLDRDVNAYLDFRIPDRFDEPITLRHLLTHTAGFEDRPVIGLFSRDASEIRDLGVLLAESLPARLWPPGVEAAYSNYGSALAGYIVERVTGVPFEDYVQNEILVPLEMSGSSFEQPLPAGIADAAAVGYAPAGDDGFTATGPEYVTLAPAGGMVMSARDAASFMRAYLAGGKLDGARILDRSTVERMRSTLFRHAPSIPGNAYGFWESHRHGLRILQHGGDTQLFHTQLALVPERDLGVYVATNGLTGTSVRDEVWEEFLDRFFPVPPVVETALDPASLERYTGSYGHNRLAARSLGKVATLLQILSVRADDDALVTSVMGMQHRWVPEGDGLFADVDHEGSTLLFAEDDDGRLAAYVSDYPMMVFRRLRWFEAPLTHGVALAGSVLLLLSALIVVPLRGWLAARRRMQPRFGPRLGRWLAVTASFASLAFVALFVVGLAGDPSGPAYGLSPVLAVALGTGLVAAILVAAFALSIPFAWWNEWWRRGERVHMTLVMIAGLVLVAQMAYWNLLGFQV